MIAALSTDRIFTDSCVKAFPKEKVVTAKSFLELSQSFQLAPTDVAVVDIANLSPFDLTKLRCSVLVLTGVPKFNEAIKLMRFGIRGYGNRAMLEANLVQAVNSVRTGQVWMPPYIISKLITALPDAEPESADEMPDISDRELQVAKHVSAGLTNKEIADAMSITVRTVKAHLTSIFNKTGLRDRVAVAIRYK